MSDKPMTPKGKRTFNWRSWLNTIGPVLALMAVYGVFVLIAPPSFATARNMEMIARQTTIVGVAALGMTMVIISGGIDLSVGSIVALSTVVIAWLLRYTGVNPLTAAVGGRGGGGIFRPCKRNADNAAASGSVYRYLGYDVGGSGGGQRHRAGAEN